MDKFTVHRGVAVALDRSNVDTDAIIPKQFLKSIKRSGFGPNLFDEWRYLDRGEPGIDNSVRPLNPDFVLNQSRYKGASVLVTRSNFGCGSSREHAPWALQDYGFRAVVASSFADIFFNNCYKIGLLPIRLTEMQIDSFIHRINAFPGFQLIIDLSAQTIGSPDGELVYPFDIDDFRKHCLIEGLDEIGLTLAFASDIRAFEEKRLKQQPWLGKTLTEANPN